jgi:hypothetical protein
MMKRPPIIYTAFLVVLLTTEFNYIEIGGGIARIYHLFVPMVLLGLFWAIPRVLRSSIAIALVALLLVTFAAAVLSELPEKALVSSLLLYANVGIAFAIACILVAGRMTTEQFSKTVIAVTVVGILWGLLQMAAYRTAGVTLALSEGQASQIQLGFGPSFFNEANGFGKYMVFPFLFFVPKYFRSAKSRSVHVTMALMLVGVIMNFTRTAIYGILVALAFTVIWYVAQGRLGQVLRRGTMPVLLGVMLLGSVVSGAVPFSDYGLHKLENLFDETEILEGDSSAFRLLAMRAMIDSTLSDSKKIWIGNGWGQVRAVVVGTEERQVGGGDIVNVFGYTGAVGVFFYLIYCVTIWLVLARASWRANTLEAKQFAEGLLFAYVGLFAMSVVSGVFLSAAYWMLVGAAMYLGIANRSRGQ